MYKTDPIDLFYPGLASSGYYRIPTLALLKSGRLLAGCDQRIDTESDYGGLIEPVIRYKDPGDADFSPVTKVLEAPKGAYTSPAYTIDMCLAADPGSDTVYMLIDKFKSFGNYEMAKKGTGFIEKNGEKHLLLFEHVVNNLLFNKEEARFYVNDGIVFDMDDKKTAYRVITTDSYPYDKLGDLYEGDKYIGNIYFDTSPLTVHQSPYLYFLKSTDGGETFSQPVDITADVATDDMMFIGASPGRGLVLPTGRIIFPVYYTVENPKDIYRNIEKTAMIYSDDGGASFHMTESLTDLAADQESAVNTSETSLIRLEDETIIMFARTTADRVVYGISHDDGASFTGGLHYVDFKSEPFCMLSAVAFSKAARDYVLLANPKGPGRANGSIKIMEYKNDKLKTLAEKAINQTTYSYSCIEKTAKDEVFALVYEQKAPYEGELREHIKYTEFDLEWLLS